jgi:hypothetical protein
MTANEMTPELFKKLLRPVSQYICVRVSYRRGCDNSAQKTLRDDLTRYIMDVLAYSDLSKIEPGTLTGVWQAVEGKSDDKEVMVILKERRKDQESRYQTSRLVQLGLWKSTYMVLPADNKGNWIPTLGQIKKAWEWIDMLKKA